MKREILIDNVKKCEQYKYNVVAIDSQLMPYGAMIGMPVVVLELTDDFTEPEKTSIEIVSECSSCNVVVIKGKLGEGQVIDPLIELMHLNEIMCVLETDGTQPTPPNFDWVIVKVSKNEKLELHEQCFAAEYVFDADDTFLIRNIPDSIIEPPYGNIWLNARVPSDYLYQVALDTPYLRYCNDLDYNPLTIQSLVTKAYDTSVVKGFWDNYNDGQTLEETNNYIGTRLCLIHSEVSEALEALRIGNMKNFREELADVVIRVATLAGGLKINLDREIREKLVKNALREHMHSKLF